MSEEMSISKNLRLERSKIFAAQANTSAIKIPDKSSISGSGLPG